MRCQVNSGIYPCSVCSKDDGSNSIECEEYRIKDGDISGRRTTHFQRKILREIFTNLAPLSD